MSHKPKAVARRAFIHVGTHKTGSTAIQAFLHRNTSALGDVGIYIPRAGRLADHAEGCGHHNIALELDEGARYDPSVGSLADVIEEVVTAGEPRVCISSEEFESLCRRPEKLVRLRDAFAAIGYPTTVVLYVRPQVDYLESLYAEIAKGGHFLSFRECLEAVLAEGTLPSAPLLFSYEELVDIFAGVFGHRHLVVRPYRRHASTEHIIREFAKMIGISGAQLRTLDLGPRSPFNPRLSFVETLGAIYGAGTGQAYEPGNMGLPDRFADAAAKIDGAFDPIRPREIVRMMRHFALQNLRLSLRHRAYFSAISTVRLSSAVSTRFGPDVMSAARRSLLDEVVTGIREQQQKKKNEATIAPSEHVSPGVHVETG